MAVRPHQPLAVASDKAYTVSQVTQGIGAALQQAFPEAFWVTGELQGFDRDVSKAGQRRWGQVYFELIEKEPAADSVRAGIKAILWGDVLEAVRQKLTAAASGLTLQDGLQVKLLCTVDFYWPRASLQLKVVDVDPNFTLGDMERARRALLENLKALGLLERNRALPMPELPLCVGLITSDGSAAYHDFVDELRRSGFAFCVYLIDSKMQGADTENDVCRALETLAANPEVQVIALARGGGSRTDLIWFDKEKIAHAIARCGLPVLTGIGHEIDLSVADVVAHASRKTPTALAQFLIERAVAAEAALIHDASRLKEIGREKLRGLQEGLAEMGRLWRLSAEMCLARAGGSLAEAPVRLTGAGRRLTDLARERLAGSGQRLPPLIAHRLERARTGLSAMARECAYKDPRRLMSRGYSLIYAGGKLAKSARDVRANEFIEARLADGRLVANVLSVQREGSTPK